MRVVTSKGQITIPADIRQALGLTAGERVVITRLDDGTMVMRAKTRSMHSLKGVLKRPGNLAPVAIDDMNIGHS